MALNAPPIKASISDANGNATMPWVKWFQETYTRIGAALGRPTTAIDADVTNLSSTLTPRVTALEAVATAPFPSYTVATVPPAATNARHMIYVSNESGGAVLAFSDGTNWRRVTDRAVIS